MFTGIVEELGEVRAVEPGTDSARLAVRGEVAATSALGESICVNGVCLTVARLDDGGFVADVMRETLQRSTLGTLTPGDPVNLERAATLQTRLGGHLVQGHVDGVGRVVRREPGEAWETVTVGVPPDLLRYVVAQGSIALDGVSLTVVAVRDGTVVVSLIPETLRRTTLGRRAVGEPVNVEVDVLAKYVEKLVTTHVDRLLADHADRPVTARTEPT